MSVLPIAETPEPEPPCCDAEPHLPPIEFPVALDPALRDLYPATPADVHIRQRRAAA